MKIEIRKVDTEKGIVQVTCPDERWYTAKPVEEIEKLNLISQEDFYPSVTWIGSFYPKTMRYMRWLAEKGWDEAEAIKNAAAEKGSRVHHACEDLARGEEVKIDSKYSNSDGEVEELTAEEYGIVCTFRKFLEDEQPIILGMEYTILNHWHQFGGTVDIKCRLKSDNYEFIHIVDIKTSAEIWPSHEIQVSAYMKTDLDCQKIDILQVGYRRNKMGYKLTEITPQFDLFLAAKLIWKKETEGVLVPQREYPLSLKWEPVKPEDIKPVEVKVETPLENAVQLPKKKVVKRKVVRKKK